MFYKTLADMKDGEFCVICNVNLHGPTAQRIADLGFRTGEKIRRLIAAPSGSPIAFWVQGAIIALRAADCACIEVTRCE